MASEHCDHKFIDSTRCLKCGWEPNAAAIASRVTPMHVVSGDEAKPKAEHPASPDKIAIVRAWLGEDNPYERVDRLLARLDACDSAPAELVVGFIEFMRGQFRANNLGDKSSLDAFVAIGQELDRLKTLSAIPRPAAPTPAWHERPTSPGWWFNGESWANVQPVVTMGLCLIARAGLIMMTVDQVGTLGWYGPVVPEQEKKL